MRPSLLRASWIASVLAFSVTAGTPVVAGASHEVTVAAAAADRSPGAIAEGRVLPAEDTPRPLRVNDEGQGRGDGSRQDRGVTAAHLLVRVLRAMTVRAHPRADAAVAGTMPARSRYYDVPITAWVEETVRGGRWGRVEIPYTWPRKEGWMDLRGLERRTTHVEVHVDLSEHRVRVSKWGRTLFVVPGATGAPVSPTPPGEYFVTDRIPFARGGYLGSFAFGISGIQPNLPPGWSGGDQLAIHGTNAPATIGTSASAGCVRVGERALARLRPLLALGTPVIVTP